MPTYMKYLSTLNLFAIVIVISTVNPHYAISQSTKIDSTMEKIATLHDTVKIVEYTKILGDYIYTNLDSARVMIDRIRGVAEEIGESKWIAHGHNIEAVYQQKIGSHEESKVHFLKSLELYRSIGNRERESALINNLAGYYRKVGKLDSVLILQMQSLAIKEDLGLEGSELAASYWNIGNVQADLQNFELSTEWYRKAEKIYKKLEDESSIYGVSYLIALNLYEMDSLSQAMPIFKEVHEYNKKTGRMNNLAGDLDNMGMIATELGNYKEAEEYLLEALEIGLANGEKTLPGLVYRRLSQLYLKTKDYRKAKKYAELSLENAENTGVDLKKISDYLVLSQVYDSLNVCQPAFYNFKLYHELYDSLLGVEKHNAISELQIKYESEKKEQEIKLLEEKAKSSKLAQQGLIGGIVGLVLLLGSLLYAMAQRRKRNQLFKEKMDRELEFSQKELESRKQELTAFALQLANKNETLENIKRDVQEVRINSADRKSIQSIVNTIEFNINDNNNWDTFRKRFESVHKDFEINVKQKYGNVTTNELRLMALLKMNLSSKEIANILNVSQEGIKKARYRLRKKLKLETGDSLEATILVL